MPWDIWLILIILGVVVPWRGRLRLRELLAKPTIGAVERISLYYSTIAFQWVAVGVAAWRAWAHAFSLDQLGLGLAPRGNLVAVVLAAILGTVAFSGLQWLNLRRMGRLPAAARGQVQILSERILPQSGTERIPFFALAVTAGICEEFLYRGFAVAAFARAGLPSWNVIVLSSVLFGLAHLYQGRSGLLGTMMLGLVFGTARVVLGSLLPVMPWHMAVDVVAGIAGPRYLTNNAGVASVLQNDKHSPRY